MNPDKKTELAQEIRQTFDLVSPFIEKHTSLICPQCRKVCCADKHGIYDNDDLEFLNALGVAVPDQEQAGHGTGPCRYITDKGCRLSRWMRPFRCTSFFCDVLLKSLESDNSKLYQTFNEYYQHLLTLRQELIRLRRRPHTCTE